MDEINSQLLEALRDLNDQIKDLTGSMSGTGTSAEGVKKRFDDLEREQKKQKELVEKTNKQSQKYIDEQKANFLAQVNALNGVIDSTGKLKLITVSLSKEQQQQINLLQRMKRNQDFLNNSIFTSAGRMNLFNKSIDKAQENFLNMGSTLAKGLGRMFGSGSGLAASLARGETSFNVLGGVIDSTAGALGKGFTAAGDGAMALGSAFKGWGTAIGFAVGGLLKLTGTAFETMGQAASFFLDRLQTATKYFQDFANMGALTATGMTGLKNQLEASGMSMEGYQRIVKENAEALVNFGGTVGNGGAALARMAGQMIKGSKGFEQIGADLRKLGYNADTFGEMMGYYMTQQQRMGTLRGRSDTDIIKAAGEYAKELDLLQKLTGKSRDELAKERTSMLEDEKFFATLMEKVDRGMISQKDAENVLKNLQLIGDPTIRQAVMDTYGGVVGEKGVAAVVNFGNTLTDVHKALTGTPEQVQAALIHMLKYGEKAAQQQSAIGGRGLIASNKITMERYKQEGRNFDLARTMQKGQMESTDKLTSETVEAQKQLELLASKMRDLTFDALEFAVPAVQEFTKALNEFVDWVYDKMGLKKPSSSPAQQPISTPAAEKQGREEAEKKVGSASEDRKRIEKEKGRGSPEARQARIAEMQARREAEIARAREQSANIQKGRGQTPTQRPEPTPGPTPGSPQGATGKEELNLSKIVEFSESGSGTRLHFDKLNPDVRERFIEMAKQYQQATGKKLRISSAFRSTEEQAKIYQAWKDAGGSERNPVVNTREFGRLYKPNPPGSTGSHESGRALDLDQNQVNELQRLRLLGTHGFSPVSGDPVHIQGRYGGIFNGPSEGYPVMLHGREAVVPLGDVGSTLTKNNGSVNTLPNMGGDTNHSMVVSLVGEFSTQIQGVISELRRTNRTLTEQLNLARA